MNRNRCFKTAAEPNRLCIVARPPLDPDSTGAQEWLNILTLQAGIINFVQHSEPAPCVPARWPPDPIARLVPTAPRHRGEAALTDMISPYGG